MEGGGEEETSLSVFITVSKYLNMCVFIFLFSLTFFGLHYNIHLALPFPTLLPLYSPMLFSLTLRLFPPPVFNPLKHLPNHRSHIRSGLSIIGEIQIQDRLLHDLKSKVTVPMYNH